jgi:BMFP domain-containing protein YqiC
MLVEHVLISRKKLRRLQKRLNKLEASVRKSTCLPAIR